MLKIDTTKEFYKAAILMNSKFDAKRCSIQLNMNWLGTSYFVFYYGQDDKISVSGSGDSPEAALKNCEMKYEQLKTEREIKNISPTEELHL